MNKINIKKIDLKKLAEKRSNDRSFLSLYLSQPEALDKLGPRMQTIRDLLSGHPDELEEFENSLDLAQEKLESIQFPAGGLCLFACWLLDYVRIIPLELDVPDLIRIGPSPYIRPLAELQEEYQTNAVVLTDNTRSRIYLVTTTRAEEADVIKGDIKNHVRVGGWSQQRYERRRDKALHDYANEICSRLLELEKESGFEGLILAGSRETMEEIERVIPQSLSAKLIGTRPLDLDQDEPFLQKDVFDLFEKQERQQEKNLWQLIQTRYLSGEPAAMGPHDVLEAARAGRVEEAIVIRDADIKGTRCHGCNRIYAGEMESCPACRSRDVFHVDLVNEIVELLALTSAEMEFADTIPELVKVGGMAALLRY